MSTYKKYGGQGKNLIKVNKTLEGQSGKLNSKVKKKKEIIMSWKIRWQWGLKFGCFWIILGSEKWGRAYICKVQEKKSEKH